MRRLIRWFAAGAEVRPHPRTTVTGQPYHRQASTITLVITADLSGFERAMSEVRDTAKEFQEAWDRLARQVAEAPVELESVRRALEES